jgi:hypothetical protein
MTFYIRNYTSEEKYDISKFMNYVDGVYDFLASPFLNQLSQLPTVQYYNVDDRFKEIDLIATDAYGDPFYAYLIQYYNNDFRDSFPEGTKLNLFSAADLEILYHEISAGQNAENTKNTGI